jgi:hypothetical protein
MAYGAFAELAGSPKVKMSVTGGTSAERVFITAWANSGALVNELAADSFPGYADLHVVDASIEPFSSNDPPIGQILADPKTDINVYVNPAVVRVMYAIDYFAQDWPCFIEKPSFDAGTTIRLRSRFSSQALTLPARAFVWDDYESAAPGDPIPEGDEVGRLFVPQTEYQVEWNYVDEPPVDVHRFLIGKTNDDVFMSAPAGTLLFEGFEIDESFRVNSADPMTWKVLVTLRERRTLADGTIYGWNQTFRANPPGWQTKLFGDPGEPLFPLEDFSTIFEQVPCP